MYDTSIALKNLYETVDMLGKTPSYTEPRCGASITWWDFSGRMSSIDVQRFHQSRYENWICWNLLKSLEIEFRCIQLFCSAKSTFVLVTFDPTVATNFWSHAARRKRRLSFETSIAR